jgi:hypothetical protein
LLPDCVAVVAFLDRALDSFHLTADATHSGQKLLATLVGYMGLYLFEVFLTLYGGTEYCVSPSAVLAHCLLLKAPPFARTFPDEQRGVIDFAGAIVSGATKPLTRFSQTFHKSRVCDRVYGSEHS